MHSPQSESLLIYGAGLAGRRVLHALVGYTDRPSAMQVLVYLGTILVMVALMQVSSAGKRRQLRTA